MTYKIYDTQNGSYSFINSGFDSLEEVREQLISYHSNDCDEDSLREQTLLDIASGFEWDIQDQDGESISSDKLDEII